MPTLRQVVAGILGELTLAQHSANQLSRELSEHYRTDTILRAFPVPNASLTELQLHLRYGVEGLTEPMSSETAAPEPEPPTSLFMRYARRIAAIELDEARRMLRAWVPQPAQDVERRGRVLESLDSERILERLTQALGFALERTWKARAGGAPDFVADVKALVATTEETLKTVLWSDPDMPGAGPPPGAVDPARWVPLLERLARAAGPAVPSCIPELEVFVAAQSLENTAASAIQTLTLGVSMDGYRWVVLKDGQEDLVPDE